MHGTVPPRKGRPFRAATALRVARRLERDGVRLGDPGSIVDLLEFVLDRFPDLTLRDFLGAVIEMACNDPDCEEFQHAWRAPPEGIA
jgi:hypothetical protein